jgi:hypothetical protein
MYGNANQLGVVHLSIEEIFKMLRGSSQNCSLSFSYLEIYNEQVLDLLSRDAKQDVKLLNDETGQLKITPLTEERVTSPDQVFSLLRAGMRHRHVSATAMNRESSRSHVIVQLTLEAHIGNCKQRSQLNLVDLAGSEGQRNTAVLGDRQREAKSINQSLLALLQVIKTLSSDKHQMQSQSVNIRNSKLTRILERSLGGNAQTVVICSIAPALSNYAESRATLEFASNAGKVENHIHMNRFQNLVDCRPDVAMDERLAELHQELEHLQELVRQCDLTARNECLKEKAMELSVKQKQSVDHWRIDRRHSLGHVCESEVMFAEKRRIPEIAHHGAAQGDRPCKRQNNSGLSSRESEEVGLLDIDVRTDVSAAASSHDADVLSERNVSPKSLPFEKDDLADLESQVMAERELLAGEEARLSSVEGRLREFVAMHQGEVATARSSFVLTPVRNVSPSLCSTAAMSLVGGFLLAENSTPDNESSSSAPVLDVGESPAHTPGVASILEDDEEGVSEAALVEEMQVEAVASYFREVVELLGHWQDCQAEPAPDTLDVLVQEDESGMSSMVAQEQVFTEVSEMRCLNGPTIADELMHVKAAVAAERTKLADLKVSAERGLFQCRQLDAQNKNLEARLAETSRRCNIHETPAEQDSGISDEISPASSTFGANPFVADLLLKLQDEEKAMCTLKEELRREQHRLDQVKQELAGRSAKIVRAQEAHLAANEARAKAECFEKELALFHRARRMRSMKMKLSTDDLSFFRATPNPQPLTDVSNLHRSLNST